jgi:hypothetical protein
MQHLAIFLQDAGWQPLLDQPQKRLVVDPLLQHPHPPLRIDVVEEASDVCFHHRAIATKLARVPHVFDGLLGAPVGAIAIAGGQQGFLIHRAQDPCHRNLQALLFQGW